MHSSRMRTARLLIYLLACTAPGGLYLVPGGVSGPGGCTRSGGYLVLGGYLVPGGCTWSWGVPAQVLSPLWTESQTPVKI